MKCESLGQAHDLPINVDVVENVGDETIFLAELGSIVEEVATLFHCELKITNNFRQRREIVARRSEGVDVIILQTRVGSFNDGLYGVEA